MSPRPPPAGAVRTGIERNSVCAPAFFRFSSLRASTRNRRRQHFYLELAFAGLRATGLRTTHRHTLMIVNLLALVIVLRADQASDRGDGLRRLLGLEAAEQCLFAGPSLPVSQAPVAKHHRVMHLQIF